VLLWKLEKKRRGVVSAAPFHVYVCGMVVPSIDTTLSCVYIHTHAKPGCHISARERWRRKVAQKGSHVQFKHSEHPGRVTVPHPERDIPIGTLRSIEKQSGLKFR
jgi:predicted RNA binding protein YcfA (HicA-like mRNA interferase family)